MKKIFDENLLVVGCKNVTRCYLYNLSHLQINGNVERLFLYFIYCFRFCHCNEKIVTFYCRTLHKLFLGDCMYINDDNITTTCHRVKTYD